MQRLLLTIILLAALVAVPAQADETTDQIVSSREAAMKADGHALHGAEHLTGDQAIAALQAILDNYNKLPSLFPKGSLTDNSLAKPVIWDRFDQFTALFKLGAETAADGIVAAKAGDLERYKNDIRIIGTTCNDCHATFRAGP